MARAYSIEDTNLNASLISSRKINYRDIDLSFAAKPAGDLFKKVDAASVKQAVKNLLLTNRGEKPFQPEFDVFTNFDADQCVQFQRLNKN